MKSADAILGGIVKEIFTPLYQLAVGVAFVYFMYGAVMFIVHMRNPDEKNTGKQHLLWGTIVLFIILSVGGIISTMNSILNGMFQF